MLDVQGGLRRRRCVVARVVGAWMLVAGCDRDEASPAEAGDDGALAGSESGTTVQEPGGEPAACDAIAGEGVCAEIDVCEVFDCGGKTAPFNHYGCPRVPCTADAECGEGERCFAVALDTACRASATCTPVEDACACGSGEAECAGTNEAHCLPVGFYPASGDCEVEALACEDLDARASAVEDARRFHDEAGHAELALALSSCATRIETAQAECPKGAVP